MLAANLIDIEQLDLPYVETTSPSYDSDPPAVWRRIRAEQHGLARTEFGVNVLSYRHCVELLRARELGGVGDGMMTIQGITSGPLYDYWTRGLLFALPDNVHHRLRRLQTPSFTPRMVDRLRSVMRETAERLVRGFVAEGRCDFVSQFAHHYPVEIIARMMGIPQADITQFSRWSTDIGLSFAFPVTPVQARVEAAVSGLFEYVRELVARRRTEPGDDLLSQLLVAEADGDRLSSDELQWQVLNTTVGGHDTTRSQLAFLLRLLCEHPEEWRALADRPERAQGVVEESLRLNPILPITLRRVTRDFTYENLRFRTGTVLVLRLDCANRDPEIFPEPDRFDPQRANAADHLSFGGGAHHCLGVHLARTEIQEALPILARAMPGLRLDGPGVWRPNSNMLLGPESMPVRFDATARQRDSVGSGARNAPNRLQASAANRDEVVYGIYALR